MTMVNAFDDDDQHTEKKKKKKRQDPETDPTNHDQLHTTPSAASTNPTVAMPTHLWFTSSYATIFASY
jgi:hypothetical protein